MKLRTFFSLLMLLYSHAVLSAVIYNVDGNGQLLGASNIDVLGITYDVAFQDGSCRTLFDGCDNVSDFIFKTRESARSASEALLSSVLVNIPGLGLFDDNPSLTNGIEYFVSGGIVTPYEIPSINNVRGARAHNVNPTWPGSDGAEYLTFTTRSTDFSDHNQLVWAVWTPTAIPEPNVLNVFLLSLLILGYVNHKNTNGL
ncbi:hypothetical protein [Vibrio sp. HN007]|uniref:hypothetical protein n=1 Tax=Vibrio iocasae TaxID=3098914 RepID=UPI0035D503A4